MPNKAYCAIMDNQYLYVPIAAPSAYAAGMPVMFGGSVEGGDRDHRDTLVREVMEESQAQILLTKGTAAFDTDPAFVHGTQAPYPVYFYSQTITYMNRRGATIHDAYNCYFIDMTQADASATAVTIMPGNVVAPIFQGATGWTAGQHRTGSYITLQTRAQLAAKKLTAQGAVKSNVDLGNLFGLFSTPPDRFDQLVFDYTGTSHVLKIPKASISGGTTDQFLAECDNILSPADRMVTQKSIDEWQDFYRLAFTELCRLV